MIFIFCLIDFFRCRRERLLVAPDRNAETGVYTEVNEDFEYRTGANHNRAVGSEGSPIRYIVTPIAIALALGASGCSIFSSKDSNNAPAKLVEIKPSIDLKVAWKASVGESGRFVFLPAVTDKRIYAADAKGKLIAYDLVTGKELWSINAGRPLSSGVGANNDIVIVGTSKGELLAFDDQGKSKWKAQLGAEIAAPTAIESDIVVARTGDGRIVGLNAQDGTRKWNYQRVTPTLALRSSAPALVIKGAVFGGFAGGVLSAIDLPTGRVGWESVIAPPRGSTELERIADISSQPVLDQNQLCAVAYQGRVACMEANSGKILWSKEFSSSAGLTMDERNIYVADVTGTVVAFDKQSGSVVWKQEKLARRNLGTPVIYNKVLLIADGFGFIHALSPDDGSFLARLSTDGSAINASPQVADSKVIFQTKKGGLYAVQVPQK